MFGCILTACEDSEKGNDEEPNLGEEIYFLLLKDNRTISLNTYVDSKIREHKTFAITENSIFATDHIERVAILDTDKNFVTLYEVNSSKEIKLTIPYNIEPITILMNGNNLFIGGRMGNEMLVQYHIQNGIWYNLEIPKEVTLYGKAIDDLVVNDNKLIAIDNVVYPKYILFYHLKQSGKLEFSHFKQLWENGTYERIRRGRISPQYLGILSDTQSGYSGADDHITIYNDLDLRSNIAITLDRYAVNDFLLIDNKLFIAHRDKGLGTFEINDSYFSDSYIRTRVDEEKINYNRYGDDEIIRLTTIPDSTDIILTIRNSKGVIRYHIIK